MPYILQPPPPSNSIADQLARALATAIAVRHEQEQYQFQKESHKHQLAQMQFNEKQQAIDEARKTFEQQQKDAALAISHLTGQEGQSPPTTPGMLESAMAARDQPNPSDWLAPFNSLMQASKPVNPTIQFPMSPTQNIPITPLTRKQLIQDKAREYEAMTNAYADRAGATAEARAGVTPFANRPGPAMTAPVAAATGLPPGAVGLNLSPEQQKMAAQAAKAKAATEYNQKMMTFRYDSLKEREKASALAATRPGAIRVAHTVDSTGVSVDQLYRLNPTTNEVEVIHEFPKQLGMMEQRLVDTNVALINTANQVIEDLQDPKVRELVGPLMSRATSIKDLIGVLPTEAGFLQGDLHALSLAIPGAHTLRSREAAKEVYEFMMKPNSPEVMEAKLRGLIKFPQEYIDAAGKGARGIKPSGTTPSPGTVPTIRKKVGGQWYIIKGDSATLDPNQKE